MSKPSQETPSSYCLGDHEHGPARPADGTHRRSGGQGCLRFIWGDLTNVAFTNTYICTYVRTCLPTCMHACMPACMPACVNAYMHACPHTCMHACTHTCRRTYTRAVRTLSLAGGPPWRAAARAAGLLLRTLRQGGPRPPGGRVLATPASLVFSL